MFSIAIAPVQQGAKFQVRSCSFSSAREGSSFAWRQNVAQTDMNERSSRGHTLFDIKMTTFTGFAALFLFDSRANWHLLRTAVASQSGAPTTCG